MNDYCDGRAVGAYAWLMNQRQVRVAILNVGDPAEESERMTDALAAVHRALAQGPFQEVDYHVSPSEQAQLRARLRVWSEQTGRPADLVLTIGGVGLALRDRMPEATGEVLERHLPGIPEYLRLACVRTDPRVAFLRLLAGVRNQTMIINLPGEAGQIDLALPHLLQALPAAVRQLQPPDLSLP